MPQKNGEVTKLAAVPCQNQLEEHLLFIPNNLGSLMRVTQHHLTIVLYVR